MSRDKRARFQDIEVACIAIINYTSLVDVESDVVFDTTHGIVLDTARNDIPLLLQAINRLQKV